MVNRQFRIQGAIANPFPYLAKKIDSGWLLEPVRQRAKTRTLYISLSSLNEERVRERSQLSHPNLQPHTTISKTKKTSLTSVLLCDSPRPLRLCV